MATSAFTTWTRRQTSEGASGFLTAPFGLVTLQPPTERSVTHRFPGRCADGSILQHEHFVLQAAFIFTPSLQPPRCPLRHATPPNSKVPTTSYHPSKLQGAHYGTPPLQGAHYATPTSKVPTTPQKSPRCPLRHANLKGAHYVLCTYACSPAPTPRWIKCNRSSSVAMKPIL
jgi:hypothetical protein